MPDPPTAKSLPSRAVPNSLMKMMAPRVAVKPKATTPSDATPVAKGTETLPFEFPIAIDMNRKPLLGVDVDWSDGKTLYVKSIQPGAVDDWNREHPGLAVCRGDRIVSVNGHSGDAEAMVRQCRAGGLLMMVIRTLRRQPVPLKARSVPLLSTKRPAAQELANASKKPATTASNGDSLYSWLPAPDPEKDSNAASRAKESDIFADPAVPEDPQLVVFLDIDGVLRRLENSPVINVDGGVLPLTLQNRALAPEALKALRYIIHVTGAGIVFSSEWRRNPALQEEAETALRAVGLRVRGYTPVLKAREELLRGTQLAPDREGTLLLRWAERRAREITAWLRENREVKNWLSLDDLDLSIADESAVRHIDTCRMAPRLILTDPKIGITLSDARRAIELMLKKPSSVSERQSKR